MIRACFLSFCNKKSGLLILETPSILKKKFDEIKELLAFVDIKIGRKLDATFDIVNVSTVKEH